MKQNLWFVEAHEDDEIIIIGIGDSAVSAIQNWMSSSNYSPLLKDRIVDLLEDGTIHMPRYNRVIKVVEQ